MKVEPIGGAVTLWAIAATTANPILYVLAGAVAGACIGASVMEGTTMARVVRLFVSLAAGFFIAAAIHSVASVHGMMITSKIDISAAKELLPAQGAVNWIMGLVSMFVSLLAWPIMKLVEQKAPPFIKRLLGAAEARIVPATAYRQRSASVVTRRRVPVVKSGDGRVGAEAQGDDDRND